MPYEGSWLDQPIDFFEDLLAADRGRREWDMIEEFNRRQIDQD